MSLSDTLLMEFCSTFAGYGNPKATRWYIGMEEGGGNSEAEIIARLAAWERRGKQRIEDLREFCRETNFRSVVSWAQNDSPRQKTWFGLIQDNARRDGKLLSAAETLDIQRTGWLSQSGDTCVLNFMPLPSPSTSEEAWKYNEWTDISEFATRKSYVHSFAHTRLELIRELMNEYKPKEVVCVGKTYQNYWQEISLGFASITFLTIQHPAARGANVDHVKFIDAREGNEMTTSKQDWEDRLEETLGRLFATSQTGKHWGQIETLGRCPTFLGYMGGWGGPLCFEWKIQRNGSNTTLLERIDANIPLFVAALGDEIGQPVEWQPHGKRSNGPAILCLPFSERVSSTETEQDWARRIYPKFRAAILRP